MFNDKQLQVLNYELDSSRIKTREKGNISLSYIEGHDVIETANRIFGYGNWSYTITKLEQVSQEQNHNQNVVICYKAVVRIIACDISHTKEIEREDVGFGSGVAKTLSDAHEGAAKEAVTDALKRAMRTFGNQFGNSLYDKGKNHYSQPNNPQLPSQPNTQQANNHTQPYQQHNNPNQKPQHLPQDYSSLYNLGLTIMEQ
ncbi:MAG: RAD52 family DNA repair protein, partial [Sulfurimonas sp.]